jgi:predicted nucleotidyltransferase
VQQESGGSGVFGLFFRDDEREESDIDIFIVFE